MSEWTVDDVREWLKENPALIEFATNQRNLLAERDALVRYVQTLSWRYWYPPEPKTETDLNRTNEAWQTLSEYLRKEIEK
jgi:hypothetical protein